VAGPRALRLLSRVNCQRSAHTEPLETEPFY